MVYRRKHGICEETIEETWYMGGNMRRNMVYERTYGIWKKTWYIGGSMVYGRKSEREHGK